MIERGGKVAGGKDDEERGGAEEEGGNGVTLGRHPSEEA